MDPIAAMVVALGVLTLSGTAHLISHAVRRGQLPRNAAIGIRTSATQSSDQAWIIGHAAAAPWLLTAAACGYGLGLVALGWSLVGLDTSATGVGALVVGLSGLVVVFACLLVGAARAHAAARSVAGHVP